MVAPRLLALMDRIGAKVSEKHEPSNLARAIRAHPRLAFGASSIVPALAMASLYLILDALDLLPDRVVPIVQTILAGTAFIFFVRAMSKGVVPIAKAGLAHLRRR